MRAGGYGIIWSIASAGNLCSSIKSATKRNVTLVTAPKTKLEKLSDFIGRMLGKPPKKPARVSYSEYKKRK